MLSIQIFQRIFAKYVELTYAIVPVKGSDVFQRTNGHLLIFLLESALVELHSQHNSFELNPAPGIKGNQIINLSKDLARSLSVISVRIVDVIPGKPYIGLEIPNENRELVTLGEILNSNQYESISSSLALALGKNISGTPVVTALDKMPHLLVAGTTGSGKSVALNAMILSLLYKSTASGSLGFVDAVTVNGVSSTGVTPETETVYAAS